MPTQLAQAHILGEQRLRELASNGITTIWNALPGYDAANVDQFLSRALPVVRATQRQSVALTEAYLARSIGRQPLGLNASAIAGAARIGASPEEVYRRPFVTVWTALKDGTDWRDAVAAGLDRAASAAATDVQLAMRSTLSEVGQADDRIVGYQRVPDGGACEFCRLVSGQRYTTEDLMPIHNHCGCGVDVVTSADEGDFFAGLSSNTPAEGKDGLTVDVEQHGELGPVLVNAAHSFSSI